MTDKNLKFKILSGMRIDPLEPAPNYKVCLVNRKPPLYNEHRRVQMWRDICNDNIEEIKRLARKIEKVEKAHKPNMEKLYKALKEYEENKDVYETALTDFLNKTHEMFSEVLKDE